MRNRKALFLFGALTIALALVGCGDDEQAPNPNPPPPPANPNPAPPPPPPTGPGGITGQDCAPIPGAGAPLHADGSPYFGSLSSGQQFASATNSLALLLHYYTPSNAEDFSRTIVAVGRFDFPDLIYLSQPGSQIPNYSFCVSSAAGGFLTPGVLDARNLMVSLMVRGTVQVPLPSYGGGYFPGGYPANTAPTFGQEVIEISVGNSYDCPAFIYDGRISGCVDVSIGHPAYGRRSRYISR